MQELALRVPYYERIIDTLRSSKMRSPEQWLRDNPENPTVYVEPPTTASEGGGVRHEDLNHGHHEHQAHQKESKKTAATAKYFCPMCPGVESERPGACPNCGMALERNPAFEPETNILYTCPMHPEIRQDHPGNCPVSGMTLEPVSPRPDA